ncbi:MAG: NAD(P)H-binding protein [Ferruginibacter sp.]|nr:NAD(P)H-binding protein [Ferruginibacter sp.]
MKVILTGSLGHISKPLTEKLVQQGHSVTVISSNAAKQKDIEALGANAAIGSLEDAAFLQLAFTGADAVYTMVPPANYFDQHLDLVGYYLRLGNNYLEAIQHAGVKIVINLSTIGAHLSAGNGILLGAHHVENILNGLPQDVSMTHMRPTEFYYNLLPQVHSVKKNGFIAANIGNEVVNAWVSPPDIADAIAEEITSASAGRKIRYVVSEELTYDQLMAILGEAIGKPGLKWVKITDEQMVQDLIGAGMQPSIAAGLTEMRAAIDSGLLYEDYQLLKPIALGKIKASIFAKEFATAYQQQ